MALGWLAVVALVAVLAPWLPLPFPPGTPDLAHLNQAPFVQGRHWLGTDPQGQDVLSVLVFGARTAVLLTFPSAFLAAFIGAVAGGAAGFWGNTIRVAAPYWLLVAGLAWWILALPWPLLGVGIAGVAAAGVVVAARHRDAFPMWPLPLNSAVMGAATVLDTVPRLVLVVALAAGTGVSAGGLLAVLAFTSWPAAARMVRAQMLRVRTLPFVEAAQATGMPAGRVWLRHAMPHAVTPLRTALPLSLASLLALESTLSFLGIGLPPNVASWGRLLASGRDAPQAWWLFLFPGILLIISILLLHTLGRRPAAR
ncbi:ABC transporter permease [Hymenobacter rubidus]|uniref:ABC transporter permease n=1 Tax=Hymenobacter rubidus TaxID=1441626 RepID=UPI00191DD251|nr:ABC transporter permease subunit [Hymenobacter rubidus]